MEPSSPYKPYKEEAYSRSVPSVQSYPDSYCPTSIEQSEPDCFEYLSSGEEESTTLKNDEHQNFESFGFESPTDSFTFDHIVKTKQTNIGNDDTTSPWSMPPMPSDEIVKHDPANIEGEHEAGRNKGSPNQHVDWELLAKVIGIASPSLDLYRELPAELKAAADQVMLQDVHMRPDNRPTLNGMGSIIAEVNSFPLHELHVDNAILPSGARNPTSPSLLIPVGRMESPERREAFYSDSSHLEAMSSHFSHNGALSTGSGQIEKNIKYLVPGLPQDPEAANKSPSAPLEGLDVHTNTAVDWSNSPIDPNRSAPAANSLSNDHRLQGHPRLKPPRKRKAASNRAESEPTPGDSGTNVVHFGEPVVKRDKMCKLRQNFETELPGPLNQSTMSGCASDNTAIENLHQAGLSEKTRESLKSKCLKNCEREQKFFIGEQDEKASQSTQLTEADRRVIQRRRESNKQSARRSRANRKQQQKDAEEELRLQEETKSNRLKEKLKLEEEIKQFLRNEGVPQEIVAHYMRSISSDEPVTYRIGFLSRFSRA